MSKTVETPTIVNPFTRPPLTDEDRALIPPTHRVPPGREMTTEPLPSGAKVTKSEREAAARAIDNKIRQQVSKVILAATRYRDADKTNMSDEELAIVQDATLPDKEVPFALKASLKVFESFQKQQVEESRPQLAIQINFGGAPIDYPRRTIEED